MYGRLKGGDYVILATYIPSILSAIHVQLT